MKKGQKYPDKLIVLLKSIALEKDSIVNSDEIRYKVNKYDYYELHMGSCQQVRKYLQIFFENGPLSCDVLTHFLGDAELEA